jgi:hypothetical protein
MMPSHIFTELSDRVRKHKAVISKLDRSVVDRLVPRAHYLKIYRCVAKGL